MPVAFRRQQHQQQLGITDKSYVESCQSYRKQKRGLERIIVKGLNGDNTSADPSVLVVSSSIPLRINHSIVSKWTNTDARNKCDKKMRSNITEEDHQTDDGTENSCMVQVSSTSSLLSIGSSPGVPSRGCAFGDYNDSADINEAATPTSTIRKRKSSTHLSRYSNENCIAPNCNDIIDETYANNNGNRPGGECYDDRSSSNDYHCDFTRKFETNHRNGILQSSLSFGDDYGKKSERRTCRRRASFLSENDECQHRRTRVISLIWVIHFSFAIVLLSISVSNNRNPIRYVS